jgi:NADPH:quinone reductase-like Zn-dependent oxidoreductase
MRVIQFSQFGDPSQLRLVERPDLTADQSTAIVKVVAAAVNPSDVKNVAGRMEQTTLPRIPGRDYSGLVVDGRLTGLARRFGEPAAMSASDGMARMRSTSRFRELVWCASHSVSAMNRQGVPESRS